MGGGVIVFSVFVIQISLNILYCYLHTCIQYTHGYMSCKHCLTKGYVSNIIFVEHKKKPNNLNNDAHNPHGLYAMLL